MVLGHAEEVAGAARGLMLSATGWCMMSVTTPPETTHRGQHGLNYCSHKVTKIPIDSYNYRDVYVHLLQELQIVVLAVAIALTGDTEYIFSENWHLRRCRDANTTVSYSSPTSRRDRTVAETESMHVGLSIRVPLCTGQYLLLWSYIVCKHEPFSGGQHASHFSASCVKIGPDHIRRRD